MSLFFILKEQKFKKYIYKRKYKYYSNTSYITNVVKRENMLLESFVPSDEGSYEKYAKIIKNYI